MSKNILEQLSQISINKEEIDTVISYLTNVLSGYDELIQEYDEAISKLQELAKKSTYEPKVQGTSIKDIQEIKDTLIKEHGPSMMLTRTFLQKVAAFKQIFDE